MQKSIKLLGLLLFAQVLLALGVILNQPGLQARSVDEPLFSGFDMDAVERLTIADADGSEVVLERAGEGWQLPALEGFPAETAKVEGLLRRLRDLAVGAPVATSTAALERFRVGAERFERRIRIEGGSDEPQTLYLGTASGTRSVHARSSKEQAVYLVDMAVYHAPAAIEDWLDKDVLQFPSEDVTAIRGGGLDLRREAAEDEKALVWRWSEDEPIDQEAADDLANRLARLRIAEVLGREEKPDFGLDSPVVELVLERRDQEALTYRLGKLAHGDGYTLQVSNRPEYFRLPNYAAKSIIDAAKRDTLLAKEDPEEAAAEGA